MVLDLEINGITRTERCIRSQNNDGPRFRRDTGVQWRDVRAIFKT